MQKALHTGFFLSVFSIFRIFSIPELPVPEDKVQTPNHAPHIKFINPAGKSVHTWNEFVPYSVEISDQEDGESRYQEIPSAEVLVKLKYVENRLKAASYLNQKETKDSSGINNMVISNCFNCHAVKTKLAGPSFLEISKKYQNTVKNRNILTDHIINGSKGIWGSEVMPSHPELTDSIAWKMIRWILNYAKDPGLNYFVGLQGSLPLIKPVKTTHRGIFIIEAYYTDHGTSDQPDKKLTGSAHTIIEMK